MLLSVVILFAQAIPAFALTESNKYSYSERHIDAYYSTGTWETADGHMHNISGQVCLRNLPNREPLNCIQIYKGCDGSAVTATNIRETNLWQNELTKLNLSPSVTCLYWPYITQIKEKLHSGNCRNNIKAL